MNQKNFRILIGVLWLVVGILCIVRNQIPFAILSFVVSGLFFYAGFKYQDNVPR